MVSVPARAGLVGNPSDLYGGAVLAVPVSAFVATVTISDSSVTRISGPTSGDGDNLVRATLACAMPDGPDIDVSWSTDIPRSVGLAGSSAIVIATLNAIAARSDARVDPFTIATTALTIERDDLGIVAGLQDRAVQAYNTPVLVDLAATPIVSPVSPARPIRLVVAWRGAASGNSGDYHRRWQATDIAESPAMAELAALARLAARAFEAGDSNTLGDLMAASADVRNGVVPLSSAHEVLADTVRRAGFKPNSTGSGGAVVAVVTDNHDLERLESGLATIGAACVVETYS